MIVLLLCYIVAPCPTEICGALVCFRVRHYALSRRAKGKVPRLKSVCINDLVYGRRLALYMTVLSLYKSRDLHADDTTLEMSLLSPHYIL